MEYEQPSVVLNGQNLMDSDYRLHKLQQWH